MNEIIKPEHATVINGIGCRAHNVIADAGAHWIANQTITASKIIGNFKIVVNLRFDDQCKNGHSSFAITGETYRKVRGVWRDESAGCIHDEISEYFPEFAPLIKWHLTATYGPTHYIANTCYLAGDRDCSGHAKGDVSATTTAIKFGNSPIATAIKKSFSDFLRARQGTGDFMPVAISHGPDKSGYKFADKYTFAGYCDKWHECPFDTLAEANEWVDAMRGDVQFIAIPTAYSDGKARELDAARRVSIWFDATDAELSLPRAELAARLADRLPALIAEFKTAMVETCGFIWSV